MLPRIRVVLAVWAVCQAACTTAKPSLSRATELSRAGGGQADVTGSFTLRYVTDSGAQTLPLDLSRTTVMAFVPDGMGGFVPYPGQGDSSGNFSISDVPQGTYTLRVANASIVSTARSFDFGTTALGRPDRQLATQPTPVYLNLDNLSPWAAGDGFNLFSSNLGTYGENFALLSPPALRATATLADTRFDYQSAAFPPALVDSGRGDRLILGQLSRRASTPTGYSYLTLARSFAAPSFTQVDGQPTTISGTMSIPQPCHVHLSCHRSSPPTFR